MYDRLNQALSMLSAEELQSIEDYISKCSESGDLSNIQEYISRLEKTADEADAAYMAGVNFARHALQMAEMRLDREDVPEEIVAKTASRYESSDFANKLADFTLETLVVGTIALEDQKKH